MGLLTFVDAAGIRWRVWSVETPASRAHLMDASYRNGWLVFEQEDGTGRRRLNQVPESWERLAPERLAQLCEAAVLAPPPRSVTSVTTMKLGLVSGSGELEHDP